MERHDQKSHFRLKLGEGQLYPEVARLLDEDCELQVENLAKKNLQDKQAER